MLKYCVVLFSALLLSFSTFAQQTEERRFVVDFEHWESCEMGKECPTLVFDRDALDQQVTLEVPCGGTFTTVTLSGRGMDDRTSELNVSANECPPEFDLTGLPNGQYQAYMMSCGLGGGVQFKLTTSGKE